MKFLIALSALVVYLQHSFTEKNLPTEQISINAIAFDSTQNFLGHDVKNYIGQELYLNKRTDFFTDQSYTGFYKDYTKETKYNTANIYNCCDGYNSKPEGLAKKTFVVLDVLKHPKAAKDTRLSKLYYLKLQEKGTSTIVYFEYDPEYKGGFPFTAVGYFEKFKQGSYKGSFVVRGRNWISKQSPMLEMSTRNPVSEFEVGREWKVVDVIYGDYPTLIDYVLSNSKGEKIRLSERIENNENWTFKKEKAEAYQAKFGDENWQLILRGKVKIGMTQEMCELAMGPPNSKKAITSANGDVDQWIYDVNQLHFTEGILTAIL